MLLPRFCELLRRVRYLVFRDRYTSELEEEIREHIARRASALYAAGIPMARARYEATQRFGNPITVQERSRDMWGFGILEHAANDARFALRRLRLRPGFSGAVIAVTALGIGATTAVFSAIDAAFLRPLPFTTPSELYVMHADVPFDGGPSNPRATRRGFDVRDAAAMTDVFRQVAVYAAGGGMNLTSTEIPQRMSVGVVSHDFFATLGIRPQLGRTFDDAESAVKGPKAVVLSDALWRSRFAGHDIVGKSIDLNGNPYTVVGIMPAGFDFPGRSDLWLPMSIPNTFDTFAAFRGFLPTVSIVRLAPGVTRSTAAARLTAQWIAIAGPPVGDKKTPVDRDLEQVRATGGLEPLQTVLVGDSKPALLLLVGASLLLLLIACANVANLLLTDAASRRREVALREVLGAGRGRITRQLLVESLVLAVLGALAGLLLAPVLLALLRAMMPANLAGVAPAALDLRVLGFSTLLALLCGLMFGLWPALAATRGDAVETIKSGGGLGATAGGLGRARRIIITAEIALTVMLLIGAGLMLRSFEHVVSQDRGLNGERVATLQFALPRGLTSPARAAKLDAIVAQVERDPMIEAAAIVNDLPLDVQRGISVAVKVPGVTPPTDERRMSHLLQASGGYFKAMGIPLLRGRTFTVTDGDSLAPRVAVINLAMARTWWPNADPLGRTFESPVAKGPITVVGVVADARERSLERNASPQMYFPLEISPPSGVSLVARSSLPASELMPRLREAVRSIDPSQAVFNLRMMDDVISSSVAPRRTNTTLIALFSAFALLLSSFGIYAVISYSVTRRAREFGIRAALGATSSSIAALVGRELLLMIGVGLVLGLAGAWGMARVIASLLYAVEPHDPATFLIVPAVLAIPALIAGWPPTRRAMSVSPVEVIRSE